MNREVDEETVETGDGSVLGFKKKESSGVQFLTGCLSQDDLSHSDVTMRPLVPFFTHIVCSVSLFKSLPVPLW